MDRDWYVFLSGHPQKDWAGQTKMFQSGMNKHCIDIDKILLLLPSRQLIPKALVSKMAGQPFSSYAATLAAIRTPESPLP